MECWGDSLLINHPRGLRVAAVMCRQKVSVSKHRGNDIWKIFVGIKVPERIQNFDVTGWVSAHPPCRDQLSNGFAGIDRKLNRFEISRQLLCCCLASPVSVLLRQIGLLKAFCLCPKSPWIEFRAKRYRIVGGPFFDHAYGVEQFSIRFLLKPQISSRFEILHNRPHGAERHSSLRGDLPIVRLNQRRVTRESKRDLETSGVEGAEMILPKFDWLGVANHVNEQPRPCEISVAGGVDEG